MMDNDNVDRPAETIRKVHFKFTIRHFIYKLFIFIELLHIYRVSIVEQTAKIVLDQGSSSERIYISDQRYVAYILEEYKRYFEWIVCRRNSM